MVNISDCSFLYSKDFFLLSFGPIAPGKDAVV